MTIIPAGLIYIHDVTYDVEFHFPDSFDTHDLPEWAQSNNLKMALCDYAVYINPWLANNPPVTDAFLSIGTPAFTRFQPHAQVTKIQTSDNILTKRRVLEFHVTLLDTREAEQAKAFERLFTLAVGRGIIDNKTTIETAVNIMERLMFGDM